jgi:hypothetical protein
MLSNTFALCLPDTVYHKKVKRGKLIECFCIYAKLHINNWVAMLIDNFCELLTWRSSVYTIFNKFCCVTKVPSLQISKFTAVPETVNRVHSHTPYIRSHRGTELVFLDFQPMRVSEEPVSIDLNRQNPVFTSLYLRFTVHVVPPQESEYVHNIVRDPSCCAAQQLQL